MATKMELLLKAGRALMRAQQALITASKAVDAIDVPDNEEAMEDEIVMFEIAIQDIRSDITKARRVLGQWIGEPAKA